MTRFSPLVTQRHALRAVFEERPAIVRAPLVPRREKPVLAIELAELPESVETVSAQGHQIVAEVAEAIGNTANGRPFSIGASEDVRAGLTGAIPIYACASGP